MTKINIKNENIFNFGGIYHVADKFDETIGKTIVETLGERRSINAVYQYDDVFRSIACSYMCGKERTESFDDITDWIDAEIGYEKYAVSSVPFTNFHNINGLRLVIQRQTISHHGTLFDTEYKYRCILTNDWEHAEAEIIGIYNERGASERIFDQMNNDFGWSHLPFSFMNENAVFLLATAIVKNFYSWIIVKISDKVEGLENTSRLKRFIFKFVSIPAKWVRTGRQWMLNLYTSHQFYTEIFT